MVFISGQIPLCPKTELLIDGDIEVQIRQCFANIEALAEAAGGGLQQICKLTVYLVDLGNFPIVNRVMETLFQQPWPARVAVGVAALPKGAEVEIEAILYLSER